MPEEWEVKRDARDRALADLGQALAACLPLVRAAHVASAELSAARLRAGLPPAGQDLTWLAEDLRDIRGNFDNRAIGAASGMPPVTSDFWRLG